MDRLGRLPGRRYKKRKTEEKKKQKRKELYTLIPYTWEVYRVISIVSKCLDSLSGRLYHWLYNLDFLFGSFDVYTICLIY